MSPSSLLSWYLFIWWCLTHNLLCYSIPSGLEVKETACHDKFLQKIAKLFANPWQFTSAPSPSGKIYLLPAFPNLLVSKNSYCSRSLRQRQFFSWNWSGILSIFYLELKGFDCHKYFLLEMFWNNHSVTKLTVDIEQGNMDRILTRLYKLGKTKLWSIKVLARKYLFKFQVCSFSIAYLSMEDKKTIRAYTWCFGVPPQRCYVKCWFLYISLSAGNSKIWIHGNIKRNEVFDSFSW